MTYDRNIRAYRETDLQSMGKEKLIVMLYRKMIEHLEYAEQAAGKDRAEMSQRLNLTQRIVTELQGALDHAIGGEIAANLASLYEFIFHEILDMQLDQEPRHASNCRQVLEPLLKAWSTVPPGTGDRELQGKVQSGVNPASPQTNTPGPRPEEGAPLVSISA